MRGGRLAAQAGQALVVALGVIVVTFLMVRAVPGDPAEAILGSRATPETLAALRAQMDLDAPLPQQFASYAGGLVQGDLGNSLTGRRQPVLEIVAEALPVTLSVIGLAVALAVALGVPLGLHAALTRRRGGDLAVRGVSVLLLATPPFLLGLALILVVSLGLGLLPAGGFGDGWPGNLEYVLLPSVALAGYLTPLIVRTVRQTALDVSGQSFVEAAIARGVPRRTVTTRHVLPNSLLPVVTLIGLNVGYLIAGAVVVEAVFALPGLGSALVQAVSLRDYPVIQGIALVTALLVVAANLLADLAYGVVDPRTRRAA